MQDNQSLFSLNFDPVSKSHLSDTAKWAKFLAISGMILLVLFIILAIAGMSITGFNRTTEVAPPEFGMASQMRIVMIITSLLMSVIAFFPLLFLLRFSSNMRTALNANDQEAMNEAFLNMKRYFRFLGIIFIIGLAMYVLLIVAAIIGSAAFGG